VLADEQNRFQQVRREVDSSSAHAITRDSGSGLC
jgi:hypothetical protein